MTATSSVPDDQHPRRISSYQLTTNGIRRQKQGNGRSSHGAVAVRSRSRWAAKCNVAGSARPTSTDPATSTEPVFEQVKAVLVVVLAANMPFVTRN